MEINALNFTEIISKYSETLTIMPNLAPLAVLIGAGAVAALALWRAKRSRDRHGGHPQRRPLLKRSASLALLHGGGMALQRLVEYHEARADASKLDLADCEFKLLFSQDHERLDFRELTRIAAKLAMSGKEDNAIQKLEEEIQKAKQNGKLHEAYELEMLLVEMYIYKGDYKKALNHKCLTEENISDARRPLYRAIISLAQEGPRNDDEAEKFWEKFCELRTSFGCEPTVKESIEETGIYMICTRFQEFKKLVDRLKEDIEKARDIRNKIKATTTTSSKN